MTNPNAERFYDPSVSLILTLSVSLILTLSVSFPNATFGCIKPTDQLDWVTKTDAFIARHFVRAALRGVFSDDRY